MEIVSNEVYTDAEQEHRDLLADNIEMRELIKYFYAQKLIDEDGEELFQLKLEFALRVEKILDMDVVRYYSISQYANQPTTTEDIYALLQVGQAREVDARFAPSWGGGLYKLEKGLVKITAQNWDSSD